MILWICVAIITNIIWRGLWFSCNWKFSFFKNRWRRLWKLGILVFYINSNYSVLFRVRDCQLALLDTTWESVSSSFSNWILIIDITSICYLRHLLNCGFNDNCVTAGSSEGSSKVADYLKKLFDKRWLFYHTHANILVPV